MYTPTRLLLRVEKQTLTLWFTLTYTLGQEMCSTPEGFPDWLSILIFFSSSCFITSLATLVMKQLESNVLKK